MIIGTWLGIQGLKKTAEIILPETFPKIEDVNKDGLPDLIYGPFEKKYQIYLQQKDGTYIPRSIIDAKEKAKLDSIYQVKQDSLKRVYESKLEKEVE